MAQDNVRERDADAIDVMLTPLSDLNLARDPIPEILVWANENTYRSEGMEDCANIRSGIADLDAVLGDDLDAAGPEERRLRAGNVAQRVVGSFIPFRGIIREISGANSHEYRFRQAIAAGMMRRAYLKGLGEARGCDYPARPMPADLIAARDAGESMVPPPDNVETDVVAADGTRYRPRPVVQPTD
ncbi:hypothetical protein [Aurantiacibacter gangjinensis]|uniref:hypothetical protein n=1 Tax=Aurantiacibacter gangjinensis TaxID=502682 RepID=UPI0009041E2B|nr:hypothetical protein [Aurantiacibacter gangjinensis]